MPKIQTAEQRAAYVEIAKLERAEVAARAPDARRVIREERVTLMAAAQGRSGAELVERTIEAARVRDMWAGY